MSRRSNIAQMPEVIDFPRRKWPATFKHTGPFIDSSARTEVPFTWEQLTGQPIVYASMGTLQNGVISVYQTIATALASMDIQLVLSIGEGLTLNDLGVLAGEPIVVQHAPQLKLIEQATLVITHAGINTALETLTQGKPMVAIPVTNDQPGIAMRLERVGVAEVIPVAKVSVKRLRKAVEKVLSDPRYRHSAERYNASLNSYMA